MTTNAHVAAASPPASTSAWSPFRHRAFAVLWTAALLSNIGTWMHDVGAGWLMTSLTPSPLMVSLVQAATTLPLFLLALPAGALADIVNRRRLLQIMQVVMAALAATLGLIVLWGQITAGILLAFTFALGACTALLAPAWQATVPQLVPREELAPAVALNSVGINVSRAIGPALGGAVIASFGVAWPFLLNAASFVAVITAITWWNPPPARTHALPAERFWSAIRTGLRYARSSEHLKATLARAVLFFVFVSAYWALLPLIAREHLGGDAKLYGLLVTCIGIGAVTGALLLPGLRQRIGSDRLVALGTVGSAVTLVTFALLREPVAAAAASLLAGASWIAVLSSLNVSAQLSLPDWVRARGLSVYNAAFFGSMALGSVLWGQVATRLGITTTLVVSAVGAVLALVPAARFHLQAGGKLNLGPSSHWPQPLVETSAEPDRGPVMITVEYRIDTRRMAEFLSALEELSRERRRDGAFAWHVFQDAAQPDRVVESFLEESWLEHLRHHERVTQADREVQLRVQAFHVGTALPQVTHFLPPLPHAGEGWGEGSKDAPAPAHAQPANLTGGIT